MNLRLLSRLALLSALAVSGLTLTSCASPPPKSAQTLPLHAPMGESAPDTSAAASSHAG
ncbi:MAG TPA: hypothetical protein VGM73_06870 [Candidatus Didemnitutus sp.]|jgi:hypothetical protein